MAGKRRRIALSCLVCRRRKVRCDRTTPACLRCQGGGIAHECKYAPSPFEDDRPSTVPSSSVPSSMVAVRDIARKSDGRPRIGSSSAQVHSGTRLGWPDTGSSSTPWTASWEKQSALGTETLRRPEACTGPTWRPEPGIPTPADTITSETAAAHDRAAASTTKQVLLRGSGFKTHYHGPSHYASIILQFEELSLAGKDLTKHFMGSVAESQKAKGQLKAARQASKRELASLASEPGDLLSLVPTRAAVDPLIRRYFSTWDSTYRILHIPSFWKQYEEFWQAPRAAPTSFAAILLLALSCVNCIDPPSNDGLMGRSSTTRKEAVRWVTACDSWLGSQSQKHVTLATYQIRLLLFLAKRVNSIKVKRAWTAAGELIRLLMSAGLHREPSQVSEKISIFEQEMRRRIWATTLEFELMTSTDCGMAPSIGAEDWDCQKPSNIHDEDFDEGCQYLPHARSLREFTQTSFLCISSQSAALRIEVLKAVNAIQQPLSQGLVAGFDVNLRLAMAEVPSWNPFAAQSTPRFASGLAKLQLLESLILIQQPFATSKDGPGRHFFSRPAFRDAVAGTLDLYKSLKQTDALSLFFVRNDLFRASLCLTYELCYEAGSGAGSSVTFNRERAIELLEYAAQVQEDAVRHLGEGFYPFWYTVTALSLVYTKNGMAVEQWHFARSAAQRILKVTEGVLNLQGPQVQEGPADPLLDPQARPMANDLSAMSSTWDLEGVGDVPLDLNNFNLPDFWDLDALW